MAAASQDGSTATTSLGGALVALAGLLLLVMFGSTGSPVFSLVAGIALAVGAGVLAVGSRGSAGIVGASRVGRVALVVFGCGPLAFLLLLPSSVPLPPVLVGMLAITVVAAATVVATVSVARAGVLHGVARWTLVVVAADALLTAAMSSVQLGRVPFLYLEWHVEWVRPLALLIWGLSVALHGRIGAIRSRTATLHDSWKASTDVGGGAPEVTAHRTPRG